MYPQSQNTDSATLAELEARARELESELAAVQHSIAMLKGSMGSRAAVEVPLTPAWDAPIPVACPPQSQNTDDTTDTGYIFLQSLQPYHALRAKWGLGSGLENAQNPEISHAAADMPVATELRLIGLLSSGVAWEQRIPFTTIAQDEGIIIGRDPAAAHITIEDESVSRAHMHLQLNESGLVASDLQSTNGSAINGEALTAYNSCSPVEDGDTLTLGYITLQVEFI